MAKLTEDLKKQEFKLASSEQTNRPISDGTKGYPIRTVKIVG